MINQIMRLNCLTMSFIYYRFQIPAFFLKLQCCTIMSDEDASENLLKTRKKEGIGGRCNNNGYYVHQK